MSQNTAVTFCGTFLKGSQPAFSVKIRMCNFCVVYSDSLELLQPETMLSSTRIASPRSQFSNVFFVTNTYLIRACCTADPLKMKINLEPAKFLENTIVSDVLF